MNEEKIIHDLLENVDSDYFFIIKEILEHEEFLRRKSYHHHENRSVYTHSLLVSIKSYKLARFLKLDKNRAAIGGLLHDFYYEDWQMNRVKKPFFQQHGFVHPKEALENSKKYFSNKIDKRTKNIIVRHMFPLTLIPPFYPESWIVTIVDKYVSFEIFKDLKQIPKYIGIRKKD